MTAPLLVVTADDNGLTKVVDVAKKAVLRVAGTQNRQWAICSLFLCPSTLGQQVVAVHNCGIVALLSLPTLDVIRTWTLALAPGAVLVYGGMLVGDKSPEETSDPACCVVASSGDVFIFSPSAKNEELSAIDSEQERGTPPAVSFRVRGPVEAAHLSPTDPLLAVGGRDNGCEVWNCWEKKSVFRAKGEKHDRLSLAIPMWVTGIALFPRKGKKKDEEGKGDDEEIIYQVACCSAHGYYWLYQFSASTTKRRPTVSCLRKDCRYTALAAVGPDCQEVIVGDAQGHLLRLASGTGQVLGRMRGPTGAIQAICYEEAHRLVGVVGLDRHVRLFTLPHCQNAGACFLKQHGRALLFMDRSQMADANGTVGGTIEGRGNDPGVSEGDSSSSDDDDDALWERKLQNVSETESADDHGATSSEDDLDREEEEEEEEALEVQSSSTGTESEEELAPPSKRTKPSVFAASAGSLSLAQKLALLRDISRSRGPHHHRGYADI